MSNRHAKLWTALDAVRATIGREMARGEFMPLQTAIDDAVGPSHIALVVKKTEVIFSAVSPLGKTLLLEYKEAHGL